MIASARKGGHTGQILQMSKSGGASAVSYKRNIILDTDVGNDIDDLLALALLSVLERQNKISLNGIITSKRHRLCAPYTELFRKFLGHDDIIGTGPMDEGPIHRTGYLSSYWILMEQFRQIELTDPENFPDADTVLKQLLETSDDKVTMVGIGFSTNIARFLQNEDNAALYNARIEKTVLMAGNFARPEPEFNVREDVSAFNTVLEKVRGEIHFVGFETGEQIILPSEWFWSLFLQEKLKPLWHAYFSMRGGPEHQECYDPATILYASGLYENLFSVSAPGRVTLHDAVTVFEEDPQGLHRVIGCDVTAAKKITREIKTLFCEL